MRLVSIVVDQSFDYCTCKLQCGKCTGYLLAYANPRKAKTGALGPQPLRNVDIAIPTNKVMKRFLGLYRGGGGVL